MVTRPVLGSPLTPVLSESVLASAIQKSRYAPIINDAGQLAPYVTFTRSSTATYFDSNGVMQVAAANVPRYDYDPTTVTRANLLRWSEDFTNAAWVKNLTDTPTASQVRVTTTGNSRGLNQQFTADAAAYTFSVALLAVAGNNRTSLGIYQGAGFAASTITVVSGPGTTASNGGLHRVANLSTTVETVVRITTSSALAAGLANVYFYPGGDQFASNQVAGDTVQYNAPQLERGSTATAYIKTEASPVGNATLRGLLIEEQRTNLLVRSAEFDNAIWTPTRATVSANAAVAPDGTLTADKLVEDTTATASHYIGQSATTVSGTTYTAAFYLKAAGRNWAVIQIVGSAVFPSVSFNLATGVVGTISGALSASMQSVGNGWYRCQVTSQTDTTSTNTRAYATTADATLTHTGDGTSGIYIWGAQLEAGAFATSYIPTTTASVTRATDFASVDNLAAIGFNASAGTFLNEFRTPWAGGSDPTRFLLLFNSNQNKRIMYFNGGTDFVGTYDGTTIIYSTGDATGVQSKVASAYSPTDRAICNSGGTVNTGAIAAGYTTATSVSFGGTQNLCGHIRRLRYYPRRLTNAQLQALTA